MKATIKKLEELSKDCKIYYDTDAYGKMLRVTNYAKLKALITQFDNVIYWLDDFDGLTYVELG